MAITPLPPLDRTASTFKSGCDTFFGSALPTFVTETNAEAVAIAAAKAAAELAQTNAETARDQAGTHATNALGYASAAEGFKDAAEASAASALASPGTSATSTTSLVIGQGSKTLTIQTGKAFVVGQAVAIANTTTPANFMWGQITAHDSGTGSLTVNATAIGGSGTLAAWTVALSVSPVAATGPTVGVNVQTVDYTILAADLGKIVQLAGATSRTFTTPAAATVGDGWYCYVQNAGNDTAEAANPVTLTIDGNASETIDGVATVTEYRGGTLLITSNGTNWVAVRVSGGFARFTQTGTFTWPTKVAGATVDVVGGGGGGSSGGISSAGIKAGGTGGGGGARNVKPVAYQSVNTSTTATVGASGTGGAARTASEHTDGFVGSAGGNSSFMSVAAYGGGGGAVGGAIPGGGGGGISGAGSAYGGGAPNISYWDGAANQTFGSTSASGATHTGVGGGGAVSYTSAALSGNTWHFADAGGGGGAGGFCDAGDKKSTGGGAITGAGGGGAGSPPSGVAAAGGAHGTSSCGTGGAVNSQAAGSNGTSRPYAAGDGGGGGQRNHLSDGQAGGNGGIPGGGGGGGGSTPKSSGTSGAGGNGGRGEIRVWYW